MNTSHPIPSPATAEPSAPVDHIAAIERWVLWLSAALLLLTLPLGSPRVQIGALCGVLLSWANAKTIGWLSRFATRRAGGKPKLVLGLVLGMGQLKLLGLGLTLYLMIRFLPLSLLSLVVGFSLLPLAALVRGLELAFRATSPTAESAHDRDPVG
ncbi:MAG TPA: ATP synthase subunit I [Pseudomonadota bacterium]|nr:ATP synthase subunit I [Pseudomonadota bacterium]